MASRSIVQVDVSATAHVPEGEPLRDAAERMRRHVASVSESVEDLHTGWSRVRELYFGTDEDLTLHSAMANPSTGAHDLIAISTVLTDALTALADEFDRIRRRRAEIAGHERAERQAWLDAKLDKASHYMGLDYRHVAEKPLREAAEALAGDLERAEQAFADAVQEAENLWSLGAAVDRQTNDAVTAAETAFRDLQDGEVSDGEFTTLYERLAALSPEQVRLLSTLNPALSTMTPPLPTSATDLSVWPTGEDGSRWWTDLPQETQKALVEEMPGVVVNTEGVAYRARSAAGEVLLGLLESDPDLSGRQQEDLAGLRRALTEPVLGIDADRSIVSLRFHENGDVLAAVALGDPDTADNVAFNVPGMGAEVRGMPSAVSDAGSIFKGTGDASALITWIGYDTPNQAMSTDTAAAAAVLSNDKAKAGAPALAYALDGFAESRQHNGRFLAEVLGIDPASVATAPRITPLAHSYGTPTLALALTMTRHAVDAAVLYGTVGVPRDEVPHASAMNVKADEQGQHQVFATLAAQDPVAAVLGNAAMPVRESPGRVLPTAKEFGALTFSSDGDGTSPGQATTMHGMIEGADNRLPENRSDTGLGYLEQGSQSRDLIVNIVNGEAHRVPLIEQSPWDTLADRLEPGVQALSDEAIDREQERVRAGAEQWLCSRERVIDGLQERGVLPDEAARMVDAYLWVEQHAVRGAFDAVDGAVDGGQLAREIAVSRLNDALSDLDEGAPLDQVLQQLGPR